MRPPIIDVVGYEATNVPNANNSIFLNKWAFYCEKILLPAQYLLSPPAAAQNLRRLTVFRNLGFTCSNAPPKRRGPARSPSVFRSYPAGLSSPKDRAHDKPSSRKQRPVWKDRRSHFRFSNRKPHSGRWCYDSKNKPPKRRL